MSEHRRSKKAIKADHPEVAAFASHLDELIKARTSENRLQRAANVGHSKLTKYLDGTEVPHQRVLQHYILRPLEEEFGPPLRDRERATLDELYSKACGVQQPRPPTDRDQVNFLELDLRQAESRLAEVTERLDAALAKNAAGCEQIAQMGLREEDLRAQLGVLTEQAGTLQRALKKSRQEYRAAQQEAGRHLAQFAEEKSKELDQYQREISKLELAVSSHARIKEELCKRVEQLDGQVRTLEEKVHTLEKENTTLLRTHREDCTLFMRLVNHASNGESFGKELARLLNRLERSEATIAQLTETNKILTETNQGLTAEVDRLTQEREFLRVTTPPQGLPLPDDRPAYGPGLYGPDSSAVPTADELLKRIQEARRPRQQ